MNKIIDRYLFIISTHLKLPEIQVLSQNQSSYRYIINKEEQQATFVLLTLIEEEIHGVEYELEFNISFHRWLQADVNHYFLTAIYLDQLRVNHTNNDADSFIQRKKMILIK